MVLDYTAVLKTKNCYPNNATPAVWKSEKKEGVTNTVTPQILLRSKQRKGNFEKLYDKSKRNYKNVSKESIDFLIKE